MESPERNDGLDSTTRRKEGPESVENWIPEDVAQWLDHIGVSHEANGGLPLYHRFSGAFALDDRGFCPPETASATLNNDPISMTTQIPSLATQSTLARETGHAALVFASYPCVSGMREEQDEGVSVVSAGEGGRPRNDHPMRPFPTPPPSLLQPPGSSDPLGPSTSDSQLPPYANPFPHPPLPHPEFLQLPHPEFLQLPPPEFLQLPHPEFIQLRWARQEPQGQEQQADGGSLEKHGPLPPQPSLPPTLEDLPSYEQAKAQTQGLGQLQNQPCYTLEDPESLPSPPRTPDIQPSAWTSLGPYRSAEISSSILNPDPPPSPSPTLGPQQIFMCGAGEQNGLSKWGEAGDGLGLDGLGLDGLGLDGLGLDGDSTLRGMKKSHSLNQRSMQFSIEANGTNNLPWNNPSSSYFLNVPPHTGPGDPRGPPPEYPFKPHQPPSASPSGKPQPPPPDPSPLFSNASSAGMRDWCTPQPIRADSAPPPECHSRQTHPERLGGPSVQHHSPTTSHTQFSQPQTSSTHLPNIQTQTPTLFSQQAGAGPSVMVQQMVQLLCKENQTLRQELQTHIEKASKLHWLEAELQRISEDYNWLINSSSKREGLDRTMRCKLEGEIRRLTVFNRDLRDRLETANHQLACCKPDGENEGHEAELRGGLIEKDRLEQEVEEQRGKAERLELALSSAQQTAQHLEEELRVKRVHAVRVEGLQQALVQLQTACEKREQLERRLRTRLESELHLMRTQQRACGEGCGTVGRGLWVGEGGAPALRELLRQREERVLALEADSTRWEQKYLQENAMRHFTMETAATASTHRIRDLYAQLIEKDALIKVLQLRNSRRDLSTLRPANSTPSISLATGLHSRQASQTDERKEGRSFLPSLQPFSHSSSSLPRSALSLPSTRSFFPALNHSTTLLHSSSTLPYSSSSSICLSSTLPVSCSLPLSTISPSLHLSSLPLSCSLPSTPLLSSHSKTGSRDSSTQTERGSESLKVLPLPSRAWLGLGKSQRTDKTRTQPSHMNLPDTDIVEILI